MNYAYTIEGTGSHSLQKEFGIDKIIHCGDPFPEWRQSIDAVYSTERDPYYVGASWANRMAGPLDKHPRHDIRAMWFKQWKNWALNSSSMSINYVDALHHHENAGVDRLNLKAAYERGDMIYYHHFVPEYFIDFAQMCIEVSHG